MNYVPVRRKLKRPKKPSKHRNVKTGGYDSKKESKRARDLKVLQRAGEISELREQVPYELIPTQRNGQGRCLERSVKYIADFVYRDSAGRQVVEDSKSEHTRTLPEYIIKRKLMLWVHGIRIKET